MIELTAPYRYKVLAVFLSLISFYLVFVGTSRHSQSPSRAWQGPTHAFPDGSDFDFVDPLSRLPTDTEDIEYTEDNESQKYAESIKDVIATQNETLGFQEVTLISLPHRTDKQDAVVVQARLTNFTLRISDGVDGRLVPEKALPKGMDKVQKEEANVVGCWRAHMDVLRDMVQRRVSSVLILEDDVDWDVSFKHQMLEFAQGARFIQEQPLPGSGAHMSLHDSPYGDDWDMLWIGHCSAAEHAFNPRRWVIPDDATMTPDGERGDQSHPDYSHWPDRTRLVFEANNGCCTTAYAISLRGAEKALYRLSMLPYGGPIDWGYSDMCRDQTNGFRCISPFPRLTGTYRPAGNSSKFSDIQSGSESHIVESGYTEYLMFSARKNMDQLLAGNDRYISERPEYTGATELSMEQIAAAKGHGEFLV